VEEDARMKKEWREATAGAGLPVVACVFLFNSIAFADDMSLDQAAIRQPVRAAAMDWPMALPIMAPPPNKFSRPPLPPLRHNRFGSRFGEPAKPTLALWRPSIDRIPAYDLRQVRNGVMPVPAIFVDRLPAELAALERPQARKDAFVRVLLPLVLDANEKLLAERRRYTGIFRRWRAGEHPTETDFHAVATAMTKYDLDAEKKVDANMLLRRIDIIPPSLALAQAALETGWGRSRFAMIGNAIYGQRTWKVGTGLVPRKRRSGERHEVKVFATLGGSVESYFRNLNSHRAYEGFRRARANIREHYAGLSGYRLAASLSSYSERGTKYVRSIRRLISFNNLAQFDPVRLERADADAATAGREL